MLDKIVGVCTYTIFSLTGGSGKEVSTKTYY